jgi:hypothetical protein
MARNYKVSTLLSLLMIVIFEGKTFKEFKQEELKNFNEKLVMKMKARK